MKNTRDIGYVLCLVTRKDGQESKEPAGLKAGSCVPKFQNIVRF